ncbi:MAG: SDR family NAD(P)-dependent oxidoreductase, partial [Bacteroidaceae bacterium]|nr:SDR family NAD(P)-dependent oxidoreductase [Bacteroidaceae bacterium]
MAKCNIIGEWAVVTGASSGIGLEFTRQLAAMGANVLMISNQAEALAQYSAEIAKAASKRGQISLLNLPSGSR